MTQNIFQYDNMNNRIELNVPEILLVREFAELIECKRNICKEDSKGTKGLRAFREFTYIWLAINWKSPYSDYAEQERHQEALKDAKIKKEDIMSGVDIQEGFEDLQPTVNANTVGEALGALLALGYSEKEAETALKQVDKTASLEDIIKDCLKVLMG